MTKIDTVTARRKLIRRDSPYWHRINRALYVGYRKGVTGGSWMLRVQHGDIKRKERLGVANDGNGLGLTYEDAANLARERGQRLKRALSGDETSPNYSVAEAISDYCNHLSMQAAATTAYDVRKRLEKHALPGLGRLRLTNLTTRKLRMWRDTMVRSDGDNEARRRSMDTANRCLSFLKAALNRAYRDGLVDSDNAWRRVEPFRNVAAPRKVFLTAHDVAKLVNAIEDPAFRDLVLAGYYTGARLGELTRALIRDVDFTAGVWNVRHGKTGRRDCHLPTKARALFGKLAANKSKDDYLLTQETGKPWSKSLHLRRFAAAVKASGIDEEATFYSLRHTYISLALMKGAQPQVLAENLGTSLRMIEKHYAKFLPSDRAAIIDATAPDLDLATAEVVPIGKRGGRHA